MTEPPPHRPHGPYPPPGGYGPPRGGGYGPPAGGFGPPAAPRRVPPHAPPQGTPQGPLQGHPQGPRQGQPQGPAPRTTPETAAGPTPGSAARFAEEKQKASRGGADGPYLGKDVQAGDEAFCTTGSKTITAGSSAGALVRSGDTLVYVSTTAAGEGADAAADCDLSLKLVEKVHAP